MALQTICFASLTLACLSRYVLVSSVHPILLLIASCILSTWALSIWWIVLYPFYISPFRHLPSPKQAPLHKRFLKEPLAETTERYMNEVPNDGVIRYFGTFNQERLLVTSPDTNKQVMQTQGYNFVKTGFAAKVLGRIIPYGLLTCNEAEAHKFQRKVLNKAFKYSNIRELFPVFWDQTLRLLSALNEEANTGEKGVTPTKSPKSVNIWDWMTRATLDTIALATFGGQWNALQDPNAPLAQSWNIIVGSDRESTPYRMLALVLPGWIWTRLPMKARYRFDKAKLEVASQTTALIEARKASLKKEKATGTAPKVDIMSEILRSSHPKSDDKLLGQALTFLAAGHDTTANALTFILYLLSKHPETQAKARAEIHAHIPSPASIPTEAFEPRQPLESLTYLTAIINEGLRLYAPIPHQRRVVHHKNTSLLNMHNLPLGTTVVVNPYSMNRTTTIWGKDATDFKPERFIDAYTGHGDPTGGTGSVFAVATFGHGPRQCIGERFARAEMLAMLAGLVGRYDWSYVGAGENGDEELQVVFPIVTKPVGGLWLSHSKVEGW